MSKLRLGYVGPPLSLRGEPSSTSQCISLPWDRHIPLCSLTRDRPCTCAPRGCSPSLVSVDLQCWRQLTFPGVAATGTPQGFLCLALETPCLLQPDFWWLAVIALIIAEQSQPFLPPFLTLFLYIWLVHIARPELRVFGVWCSGDLGVGGCMSPDLRSPSTWGLGRLQGRYRYRCGGSVLHLI